MEKKSSEILRRAARALETKQLVGGCHAIAQVVFRDWRYWEKAETVPAFKYYYRFRPSKSGPFWFPLDDQGPRILALCLAAAIAESEGD